MSDASYQNLLSKYDYVFNKLDELRKKRFILMKAITKVGMSTW